MSAPVVPTYVGQVEQDPHGGLWAVLYCEGLVVTKEHVRSLRKGKRRVADLVLGASDSFAELQRSAPTHLNRLFEQRPPSRRRRRPGDALTPHARPHSADGQRASATVSR